MEKIIHPKVFISYAWGSKEHQMKVLSFASSLVADGIEVLLDKWDVAAGNDMNSFMERSVLDPEVTNVLILLDENYTFKANQKQGGVGTETQIISQQVYASVDQNKFIPIVFERDRNGAICKPTYLLSRFHFDLSKEDTYDNEYQNLVKTLYGVEIYKKPEIGNRPSWVDTQITVPPRIITEYDILKENRPNMVKAELFVSFLNEIRQDIVDYLQIQVISPDAETIISAYEDNRSIRAKFLLLLSKSSYYNDRSVAKGVFFETTHNQIDSYTTMRSLLGRILLHELFIYTIAYLFKMRSYTEIGYLLGRTYFGKRSSYGKQIGKSFDLFYSGSYHTQLDSAVNNRDKKRYLSGTAAYWISTLDLDFCSKEDFVTADNLCFNYSFYGNNYLDEWPWFPITYVYDDQYDGCISRIGKQLASKEKLESYLQIFNYESIDVFKTRFREIEQQIQEGKIRTIRYPDAFDSAPLLGYFIKTDNLGIVR